MSWLGGWLGGTFGKWFGHEPDDEDEVPIAQGGHNRKKHDRALREQEELAHVLALKVIYERKEAARKALEEDEAELVEMASVYMAWRQHE